MVVYKICNYKVRYFFEVKFKIVLSNTNMDVI